MMKCIEYFTEYHKNWLNKAFSNLIKAFGGKCQGILGDGTLCNSTMNLEFAHTKPTQLSGSGRGKLKRYYDIKNNPDCYTLLCSDCHYRRDGRNKITERENQRQYEDQEE